MDAIKLLTSQHRDVEDLFEQFESSSDKAKKKREELCEQISDQLAIHNTIEEKIFYPATKDARTEELLREAVEEHLAAKRIIADIVEQDLDDEQIDAKMSVLKEQFLHHVKEEEKELFPKVKKLLDGERLGELGDEMESMMRDLEAAGEPRMSVPDQTDEAAPI